MGILKPRESKTVYVQEFSWKRSPEIWGTIVKYVAVAIVAGIIIGISLTMQNSDGIQKTIKGQKAQSVQKSVICPSVKIPEK